MDESNCMWHRAFCLLVAALCGAAIGAVGGFEFRDRIQRDHDAQPKARPAAVNPANLIQCSDPIRSREEVSRICRARLRSGMVGAK